MESGVYKRRMILMVVFLFIALLGAIPFRNSLIKVNNSINDAIDFVELNDDSTVEEETEMTKEEALDTLNRIKQRYEYVDKVDGTTLYIGLALVLYGIPVGFMMYFIFVGFLLKKFLPDLKTWMSWLMRIIVLILLFRFLYLPVSILGLLLGIPYLIYNIYKYIKTRNVISKEDML